MKFLFVFLLILSLFSCGNVKETLTDNTRYHGSRAHDPTQKRRIPAGSQMNDTENTDTTATNTGANPSETTVKTESGNSVAETPEVTQPLQQGAQTFSPNEQKENIIFPVSVQSGHDSIHLKTENEEHNKISISVKPETKPMVLLASLSGILSIETDEDIDIDKTIHTLTINAGDKTIHFELDEEYTKLLAEDGQTVNQKAHLAETTAPIIYYIKQKVQLLHICMNELTTKTVNVVKDFSDHPICSQ